MLWKYVKGENTIPENNNMTSSVIPLMSIVTILDDILTLLCAVYTKNYYVCFVKPKTVGCLSIPYRCTANQRLNTFWNAWKNVQGRPRHKSSWITFPLQLKGSGLNEYSHRRQHTSEKINKIIKRYKEVTDSIRKFSH